MSRRRNKIDESKNEIENINFYQHLPNEYKHEERRYPMFDQLKLKIPFRVLIEAPSGLGKTNLAMNIVNKIPFDRIFLIARDTSEPLYQFFIDTIQKREKIENREILTVGNTLSELPDLDDGEVIDPEVNNLILLDDMICEKDIDVINPFFIRGRKKNCSLMFLSQKWFDIPTIIRRNITTLCIFPMSDRTNFKNIIKPFSNPKNLEGLMTLNDRCLCSSTPFKHHLMIDITPNQDPRLKYRISWYPVDPITGGRIHIK